MSVLAPYLEGFKAQPQAPGWLQALRQESLQRAETCGFPTTRDEAWKYTSIAMLEKRGFQPSAPQAKLDAATLASLVIPAFEGSQAVFVNGRYQANLSRLPAGVRVVNAGSLDEDLRGLLKAPLAWENDTFLNLNTALFQDMLSLALGAGTVLEAPLEILHVSMPEAKPASHYPRYVLKLGESARALVVERYVGLE